MVSKPQDLSQPFTLYLKLRGPASNESNNQSVPTHVQVIVGSVTKDLVVNSSANYSWYSVPFDAQTSSSAFTIKTLTDTLPGYEDKYSVCRVFVDEVSIGGNEECTFSWNTGATTQNIEDILPYNLRLYPCIDNGVRQRNNSSTPTVTDSVRCLLLLYIVANAKIGIFRN